MPLFWYLEARGMLDRLAAIESGVGSVRRIAAQQKEIAVMAQEDIDRLKRIVAENTSVTNSVVTLLQGLAQQIREASDDPEEIRNLADQLNADVRKLTEAVTANTPPQPAPAEGAAAGGTVEAGGSYYEADQTNAGSDDAEQTNAGSEDGGETRSRRRPRG